MAKAKAAGKSKEYVRQMPATWYLNKKMYALFMVRELTSIFVGGYSIFLICIAYHAHSMESFEVIADWMKTPASKWFHTAALIGVLWHTITWLNLVPQVVVVWQGDKKVNPLLIAGGHYAAWLGLSAAVAFYFLGGFGG